MNKKKKILQAMFMPDTMIAGAFKMKGYSYPGKSPIKDTGDHKHTDEDKTKHPVTETRGKNSITKSGDGKSSTYKLTSSKPGKNKGETINVYTNELGNTETRVVSAT